MADNTFNRSGLIYNRFLDLSANMIPVIAAKLPPFDNLISDGVNGFLASNEQEWLEKTTQLIKDKELRTNIGNMAFKMVWENHSYTPVSINELRTIFA
ncbi:MAG: glycosyltransferase family 1 protein [Bacteroidetes bacterium]|nr:glycosyltransferase family 1 protein [Bacteroidota bacterium]